MIAHLVSSPSLSRLHPPMAKAIDSPCMKDISMKKNKAFSNCIRVLVENIKAKKENERLFDETFFHT